MNNWYIVSTWKGRENSLVKGILAYNAEKSINIVMPFIPTKETFFKRAGNIKKETSVMFPGYVFIETSMGAYDFLVYSKKVQRIFRDFITVLRYGDSDETAVRWEERFALLKYMDDKWCIETSLGFRENDVITIIEGALVGHEAQIKKIDNHKMRAWVEVEILGKKTIIELGLQMITL